MTLSHLNLSDTHSFDFMYLLNSLKYCTHYTNVEPFFFSKFVEEQIQKILHKPLKQTNYHYAQRPSLHPSDR
jgi:hypothetical protein